jgi:YVTN family beta-propeller protein
MTAFVGIASGVEIGGYRVEELIGRGGMGEVYRAHDAGLDRNVALKILIPRLADDDVFRERLLRESRLAASLDHPNVVPVYDAGDVGGRFFLAMRYVEGTDLHALLRSGGALPATRALEIAGQVAAALDAAHEQGLVHRDVKPSNVLIDERGHCYLADFGLTQSVSDRAQATDGSLLGTLDYVAPEQIRGGDVDGRADVYSLGCLLFECLTGEVPFARPSEVATLYAHLEDEPPRPGARRPELPEALDDVLGRAMAKSADDRQPSCSALVEEARAALGLAATPTPRRRALLAAVIALLLVTVVLAVAVVAAVREGGSSAAQEGSLIRIDPRSGDVSRRYAVSAHPGVVATSAGRVWVADVAEGALWRLEPATGELKRVGATGRPYDLAALAGKVYVSSANDVFTGAVARYDAVTGARERSLDLSTCSIGSGLGVLWSCGIDMVNRLSTDFGPLRILRTVHLPYRMPLSAYRVRTAHLDIAAGFGSVWILGDGVDRRLWRIHPRSGRVLATIELPLMPRAVAVGEGGVWISAPMDDVVLRIDPSTNAVTARIPTGRGASGIAAGAGSVWVANTFDGTVSRIDPATAGVVSEIEVGGRPHEVAIGAGGVWVSSDAR